MTTNRLWLTLVLVAGAILGTLAVRARERTYTVPKKAAPASIPMALTGATPPGFVVRTFDVEGICCQGCSGKLHGALMALDGVREAAVDPLDGQVSVLVKGDVASARLAEALTFDKYRARAR